MTGVTVGVAGADDVAEIRRLLDRLHPGLAAEATVPEVRQESRTFVARAGEETVGLLIATFVDYGIEAYGTIEELVVDEAHRREGIGGALVQECCCWFTGLRAGVVFVSALDEAERFYQAAGFLRCSGQWLYRSLAG